MRLTKYEPSENSMFPYKSRDEELSTELDIIHKLGQLEDIEEEIGINLITLFKALKNGIWIRLKQRKNTIKYFEGFYIEFIYNDNHFALFVEDGFCPTGVATKDYGKTWALTKEELQ